MTKTQARSLSIKGVLASTFTIAITIGCSTLGAIGAPSDKPLTPEQFAQRSAEYLRYRKYVDSQLARLQQTLVQQKQQELQKLIQEQAAQNTGTEPKHKPIEQRGPVAREDVLLVMPNQGAKLEDVKTSVENAQGEIIGALGAGSLSVILVKAQPGMVVKLQRALAQDTKNFKYVDFNRKSECEFIPTTEPTFPKAWHLGRMHIHQAWDILLKHQNQFPTPVAVFDSGVEGPESWLSGHGADCTRTPYGNSTIMGMTFGGSTDIKDQEAEVVKIGNAIQTMTYGNRSDVYGHGTRVASVLNGSPFNGIGSAGVNPMVPVFSVIVAYGPLGQKFTTDDLCLIKAMCVMYDAGYTRIINISMGPLTDPSGHRVLHEFFRDWYYRKGGLIFLAAGNHGEYFSEDTPYVVTVSGMARRESMVLRTTSARGKAIDFTAPGSGIPVSRPNGLNDVGQGTSMSCPIVAGVASMIWTINPKLTNTEVLKILKDSCENSPPGGWNPNFGWGMPNAERACKLAEDTLGKK